MAYGHNEVPLIFRIANTVRCKFGGAQLQIRPKQLRVFFVCLLLINALISYRARSLCSLAKEFSFLNDPCVAVPIKLLLANDATIGVSFRCPNLYGISTH